MPKKSSRGKRKLMEQDASAKRNVLGHPIVWGLCALIALAVSFSQRSSVAAAWAVLCLAWLLTVAALWTSEKVRSCRFGRELVIGMSAFILFGFGWWLIIPVDSPLLEAAVLQIYATQLEGFEGTLVIAEVQIRNEGFASIVDRYEETLVDGEEQLPGKRIKLPDPFTVIDRKKNFKATFKQSDAIYEKTITPIPKGGISIGWLPFLFSGKHNARISSQGEKLKISFYDYQGHKYTVDGLANPDVPIQYFPGGGDPFGSNFESSGVPDRK